MQTMMSVSRFAVACGYIFVTQALIAAENKTTEMSIATNDTIVTESVNALKKQLGLTSKQIDTLLKNAEPLKSSNLSETALTDKLNAILVESEITGAQILNRHDPLFWLYRARFGVKSGPAPAQIPAWLTRRGNNWHVYIASNLERDGTQLKRGDEITFEEGFPLTFSAPTEKRSVKLRSLSWDKPKQANITLEQKSLDQLLLEIIQTTKTIHQTGKTVTGYVVLPSSDLPVIREHFVTYLEEFAKTTDQLVIDLRGPYGEGGLSGVDLFLNDKGERIHYTKPLYVLTDRYTSGGREVLAGMLQRHAGAIVAGEETPGKTAPIELVELIPNQFILIFEQASKTSSSSPLLPDLPIKENLMFAAGRDDILGRTLGFISKK